MSFLRGLKLQLAAAAGTASGLRLPEKESWASGAGGGLGHRPKWDLIFKTFGSRQQEGQCLWGECRIESCSLGVTQANLLLCLMYTMASPMVSFQQMA